MRCRLERRWRSAFEIRVDHRPSIELAVLVNVDHVAGLVGVVGIGVEREELVDGRWASNQLVVDVVLVPVRPGVAADNAATSSPVIDDVVDALSVRFELGVALIVVDP